MKRLREIVPLKEGKRWNRLKKAWKNTDTPQNNVMGLATGAGPLGLAVSKAAFGHFGQAAALGGLALSGPIITRGLLLKHEYDRLGKRGRKSRNEDVNEGILNKVKKTWNTVTRKRADNLSYQLHRSAKRSSDDDTKMDREIASKDYKRYGKSRETKKFMTGFDRYNEDTVNEISNHTLSSYISKAGKNMSINRFVDDRYHSKSHPHYQGKTKKRAKGILKAAHRIMKPGSSFNK